MRVHAIKPINRCYLRISQLLVISKKKNENSLMHILSHYVKKFTYVRDMLFEKEFWVVAEYCFGKIDG